MRTTGVAVVLFIVLCNSDSEVRAAYQTKEAVVRTNDMVLNPINSRRSEDSLATKAYQPRGPSSMRGSCAP